MGEVLKVSVDRSGRTVLPARVREALGVTSGDEVAFVLEGRQVTLVKAGRPTENPFAAFQEWASPEDDEAYGSL